jgi:hypothetical protein
MHMSPGDTGVLRPAVDAGCVFVKTDTKCVAVSLWCNEQYICRNPSTGVSYSQSGGWYLCGACIGFDW